MKIFENGGWGNKVNFVDENNVVLGFDMSASCCESFGWYIIPEISEETQDGEVPKNIEDYSFDKDFFQELDETNEDCGGIVVFKILSKTGDIRYIHLYNFHNGYYSHGFDLVVGGLLVNDGSL